MTLTSPGRVLWPDPGVTKRELADYLLAVADRLLPHLADRPLTLKRFPRGVGAQGFFQKNLGEGAPEDLDRYRVWTPTSDRYVTYPVVQRPGDLEWLAQQAALELHPMLVRTDRPERPDTLVFDLDPPEGTAGVGAPRAARWLREVLEDLGLRSLVKTSGKRGLHVYVPVERRYDHPTLRGFGLGVASCCAAAHPGELTVEMSKAERHGRLLLDWSRNGPAQTSVAAWSPRPTPEATVSMPLRWDEVTDDLDPRAYTVRTAVAREDAWGGPPPPQRIERALATLRSAGYDCADRDPRSR